MFEAKSQCFQLSFTCVKSCFPIHVDILTIIADYKNGNSEELNFKIKLDGYSPWNFSNSDKQNGFRVFNGLCADIVEMNCDLKCFRINANIKKLGIDTKDDQTEVEMLVDCEELVLFDEIFTNVSINCLRSNITLVCRILAIKPLTLNPDIDFDSIVPFTLDKKSVPYLVGHRGLGQDKEMAVIENTIYGFNRCAELNMNFVELDVHFSKDDKIVVFHDFFMDKDCNDNKIEIKSLTHKEIHDLLGPRSSTGLFPTLDEVLSEVSPNIGMLIEFKYPLVLVDGKTENHHQSVDPAVFYMSKNEYVDKILNTIFHHVTLKPRKLVLISFEPDICLLLKLKQAIFPVMCITRGALLTGKVNHADSRIFHYDNAVSWARFCGLNGIVSRYHEFLADNFKSLADSEFLTFIYGQFPRQEEFYRQGRCHGIDGLIIDDVEDYLKIIKF